MATRPRKKSDINAKPLNLDIIVDSEGTIDNNADYEPKTFSEPDQINTNFISNDIHLGENQYSQEEYLYQISYYAEELLVALEDIFIGGHAQQVKEQLYVALNNYRNGKQDEL
jgi:hypothetical protein